MVNQHLDCDEDEADKTRNYLFLGEKCERGGIECNNIVKMAAFQCV